tara:strand:+ start:9151 stop:9966 length:816 start_codon:yes stop_codon:yes gene_type:complete
MPDRTPKQELEHYFDKKKDYHRDIIVDVPYSYFTDKFDKGNEICMRIRDIRQRDNWQNITAEEAEITSGGADEFYLHKAAIIADSINKNGLYTPVHAHWDWSAGQTRHPSNDKASVISALIAMETVPVLWRDCRFHHDLFPDAEYTNWFKDFPVTEITSPEQYGELYGEQIYDSQLRFESQTMTYIWDNYPEIWGKLKPLYTCYNGVFGKVRGYEDAENCVYCAVFDRYHRLRMRGNQKKLGDILQPATEGIFFVTETIERFYSWEELGQT